MNVSEKMKAIAENQEKVYCAGYVKGYQEGQGVLEYAANMSYTYNKVAFPSEYQLDITLLNVVEMGQFLGGSTGIRKATVTFGENVQAVSMSGAFQNSKDLEEVVLIKNGASAVPVKVFSYCFGDNTGLKKITGVLDLSQCTAMTDWARNCSSLTEFQIAPNSVYLDFVCSRTGVLTDETVQSVIDGLGDLTGTTPKTLTLRSQNGAKLTDAQKAAITAKNWTLVY